MKSAAACNVMQVGHRNGDQKKEQWERGSVGQGAVEKGAAKEVAVSHSTCMQNVLAAFAIVFEHTKRCHWFRDVSIALRKKCAANNTKCRATIAASLKLHIFEWAWHSGLLGRRYWARILLTLYQTLDACLLCRRQFRSASSDAVYHSPSHTLTSRHLSTKC